MELSFKQSSQTFAGELAYETEFSAEADFNLHVERKRCGRILFYQKTSENGNFAIIDGLRNLDAKGVIDIDFTALIYPKTIKIVSESEPTLAVVTYGA